MGDHCIVQLNELNELQDQAYENSLISKEKTKKIHDAVTPKKARKFKKPVSPSKKKTLVTVEEEDPEPSKKVKKAPATTEKGKRIDLLSEAALLEEAQVKKVLKRSQWEMTIHQAGGSGDGTGSKPGVPDEPKGKFVDTYKGTGDDEDFQDSDDDLQQADDERTDFENQEINDYEEESANEFVHTPEDYGPTNDETNDETKDVDEKIMIRIVKKLYVKSTLDMIDDRSEDDEGEAECINTNESTSTTITSLLSSLFPSLQQSIPIPTSTNTKATTSIIVVPKYETLFAIHQRITDLEKDVKELKSVDNSTTFILAIKSKVLNDVKEYLESSLDDALYKTKVLIKKRKPDDADKDEDPTTRSDRGLKGQRTSIGTKTSKKTSTLKDSSKGKTPSTSSKSSKSGKSVKDQVFEPISMQDSDNAEHDDAKFDNTDMPMDHGEDLGKTDKQPNDETVPKNGWYKKSRSDTSPDPEWNEGKLVDDGPEQSWLNDLAKATKTPLTFDELIHTPIDFSAFAMNRLKIDNLIKEHLVGPVYNLLKGTCKSYVELDYTMEECYHDLSE
ncbi:hypothetical protein Tco_0412699 [Tanacetum coccineum]